MNSHNKLKKQNEIDILRNQLFKWTEGDEANSEDYKTIINSYKNKILCLACRLGDMTQVSEALALGANINSFSDEPPFFTPLIHAALAENNSSEVCEFLIERGADINLETRNKVTALHVTMDTNNSSLSKMFLQHGANANVLDGNGRPPIYSAINQGFSECVNEIFPYVDDSLFQDNFYRSILHLALDRNNITIANALLKHPAIEQMLSIKDIYGRTPLDIALANGLDEIISKITTLSKKEYSALSQYNHPPTIINQEILLDKFKDYLKLNQRDESMLNELGNCNGWALLAGLATANGKENEFYRKLEMIANWDSELASLRNQAIVAELSDKYTDLGDLFEQMINDVSWFMSDPDKLFAISKIAQHERTLQFQGISDHAITEELRLAMSLTSEHLEAVFDDLAQMPGKVIILNNRKHAVSINTLGNGQFSYHDSNMDFKLPIINSVSLLSDIIRKSNYQENGLDSRNMELIINILTFENTNVIERNKIVDKNFIEHILAKTSPLDEENIKSSLELAIRFHSPESIKAILKHVNNEYKYIDFIFNRAISTNKTNILITMFELGFLEDRKNSWIFVEKTQREVNALTDFYMSFPPASVIHTPLYEEIHHAIDKNNKHIIEARLKEHSLSLHELQDLFKIAILSKNTQLATLIFSSTKGLEIKKEYIDYAKEINDPDLIKTLFSYQTTVGLANKLGLFEPTKQPEMNNKSALKTSFKSRKPN